MAIWNDYNWKFWSAEEEPLPRVASKHRRISICTTCMNRLHDLKETLPKNIEDNKKYPNVEFVLLDYNSTDGLSDWVLNDMMSYVDSGILVYYKTYDPEFFKMGHSRNVAFKLATGNIVNNVDADNFTGKGFADIINKMADIAPSKAVFAKGKRMMHGRIGMYKNEFLSIGGYDEDLTGYGFDDHSVVYRAMGLGFKFMWWGAFGNFSNRIKTSRKEVTTNMKEKRWKDTEKKNKEITLTKLGKSEFVVNQNRHWGKASVIKNFIKKVDSK